MIRKLLPRTDAIRTRTGHARQLSADEARARILKGAVFA
jgi:hypothetical protein